VEISDGLFLGKLYYATALDTIAMVVEYPDEKERDEDICKEFLLYRRKQ